MDTPHLHSIDGHVRERETLRRLVGLPHLLDPLIATFSIQTSLYWVALNVEHGTLIDTFRGDVDLMAGPLTWSDPEQWHARLAANRTRYPDMHPSLHPMLTAQELAASGALKWPPDLDLLVALEAKVAHFDLAEGVKGLHASTSKLRDIHRQTRLLLEMGFDRVALLDVITNPPGFADVDGQPWLVAASFAAEATRQMSPILEQRLPAGSPAGHVVLSWGSVAGADESVRGTGYPTILRPSLPNPLLEQETIRQHRSAMKQSLQTILARMPRPHTFPAIFDNLTR